MSDSDSENAIEKVKNIGIGENNKGLSTRNQRMRYWSNYEELRLIELWRRHIREIPSYDKNLPVHRIIAEGMKERRLHLNAQECRRRISGLRKKYLAECQRLKLLKHTTAEKSDWYLFPYIDCIFNPRVPNCDLNHEEATLQRVHDTIRALRPSLRKFTPYHGYKRIQYSHDPDTFPFLPQKLLYKNAKGEEAVASPRLPLQAQTPNSQKTPSTNTITTTNATTTTTPTNNTTNTNNQSRRNRPNSILPTNITMEQIDKLRIENERLETERDNDLKMLKFKEAEVEQLQKGFEMIKENNATLDLEYLQYLMNLS